MEIGFEFEAARSKRADEFSDAAPVQEKMRARTPFQRKPSADQKRTRREMQRQREDSSRRTATTKESTTMSQSLQQREAEILRALASSNDLAEQRRLTQDLEQVRAERTAAVQADRDLDLASAVVRDTLTPVATFERHTAATDWITEEPTGGAAYDHAMQTSATLWMRTVHEAVLADADEFAEQARGMARREAGKYGEDAIIAGQVFLDTAARLRTLALEKTATGEISTCKHCGRQIRLDENGWWVDDEATGDDAIWKETCDANDTFEATHEPSGTTASRKVADDRKIDPGQQNGNAESTVTDYDAKTDQKPWLGEDWDGDETGGATGVHPPLPGAGERTSDLHTAGEGQRIPYKCPNCGNTWTKTTLYGGETCKKCQTKGEVNYKTSAKTAIHLTNVGLDGDNGVGTASDGTRVTFRLTDKERADLKAVLYSDLAVNFSGVDIEEGDIISQRGGGNDMNSPARNPQAYSSLRMQAALSWGPAGRFPGMPDTGAVSASLPNGGSVMVAPAPDSDKVEVVYFSPGGSHTLLLSDAGSVEAGRAMVESRLDDIQSLGTLKTARALREIAADIKADWGSNVNYAAKPYLDAMAHMDSINDKFGEDEGKWVVAYFLNNAASYRGEKAKALKEELRGLQKGAGLEPTTAGEVPEAFKENWNKGSESDTEESGDSGDSDKPWEKDSSLNVWGQNGRTAADSDGPSEDSQDGSAKSSLPEEPTGDTDKTMWPVDLPGESADPSTGDDAADVSGVPTPGGESGYPQPRNAALEAFRAKVRANLHR